MSERDQKEIASRLGSIDRRMGELIKIFDAMNTNIVAAVQAMRMYIPAEEEAFKVDPDQAELPIRRGDDTTLGDKDTNGDDDPEPSIKSKYLR